MLLACRKTPTLHAPSLNAPLTLILYQARKTPVNRRFGPSKAQEQKRAEAVEPGAEIALQKQLVSC